MADRPHLDLSWMQVFYDRQIYPLNALDSRNFSRRPVFAVGLRPDLEHLKPSFVAWTRNIMISCCTSPAVSLPNEDVNEPILAVHGLRVRLPAHTMTLCSQSTNLEYQPAFTGVGRVSLDLMVAGATRGPRRPRDHKI